MDFLVRLFRVLAFERRLAMVQLVANRPGITLTDTWSRLQMPQPDASRHMKLLSAHGVIDARPSGRYLLAEAGSPSETTHVVLRRVRHLLSKYLKDAPLPQAARAVCPDRDSADWPDVFSAMRFEFTAYTHLRRLLILRLLIQEDTADLMTIMRTIGMSHTAARRQTDKLVRRGILRELRSGRRYVLQIRPKLNTTFRSALFAAVRDYLVEG